MFYAGNTQAGDGFDLVGSATVKLKKSSWYGPNCTPVGAIRNVGDTSRITTLAGFSSGRLGPVYYLKASPNHGANVTRVVMFDPGNKDDLTGECGKDVSKTIAKWLRLVPNAKLIILAGARTGEHRHQGIQDVYFAPAIRGTSVAKRVIVCNPREYQQWTP